MQKTPLSITSIEVEKDDGKKYIQHGSGLCYDDGGLQISENEISYSLDAGDEAKNLKGKFTNCHQKVAFTTSLKTGWAIGIKQGGVQYLEKPLELVSYDPTTEEWTTIETFADNTPTISKTGEVTKIDYGSVSSRVDLYYEKVYGEVRRKVEIDISGSGFDYEYIGILSEVNREDYPANDSMATFNNGSRDDTKTELNIVTISGKYYFIEYIENKDYDTVKFNYTTHSANITANETWSAGTHYVSTSIDVNNSAKLTIDANVIVKLNTVVILAVNHASSEIDVNGTESQPVYFTSKNDDTIGESISGSTGIPIPGDWNYLRGRNGTFNLDYSRCFYATWGLVAFGGTGIIWNINDTEVRYGVNALIRVDQANSTWTLRRVYFLGSTLDSAISVTASSTNFSWDAKSLFCAGYDNRAFVISASTINSASIENSIFISDAVTSAYEGIDSNADLTLKNILVICVGSGGNFGNIVQRGGTGTYSFLTVVGGSIGVGANITGSINLKNSLVTGCTTGVFLAGTGSFTSDYNCIAGNASNYNGVAKGANDTEERPQLDFTEIALRTGYFFYNGFFPKSGAVTKNAGSDTASNLGVNEYTTDTDLSPDSGTADIGFHYFMPLSPTISIDEGESTTSSTANLTLSCTNADKMRFRVNAGSWTAWESYSTSKQIDISSYSDQTVIIEVQYWNAEGGYSEIKADGIFKGGIAPIGAGETSYICIK